MSPLLPAARAEAAPDPGGLRTFQVVAAQDMPFYGAFTVEAADPESALAKAKATLLADAGMLSEREPEGVHSLRIIALQEHDNDPLYTDVSLDPDAPLWPGREVREALLSSTAALAHLLASLGETEAHPAELDQLVANLRVLHLEFDGAAGLAASLGSLSPEAWVEHVMQWGWSHMAGGAR